MIGCGLLAIRDGSGDANCLTTTTVQFSKP
jgi:hypothetical protein